MSLPFVVSPVLSQAYQKRWVKQFVNPGRDSLEGLWRRTQSEINKNKSGWQKSNDCRRRIIHYFDGYRLISQDKKNISLSVFSPYVWLHLGMPEKEINQYYSQAKTALEKTGWLTHKKSNKDYQLFIKDDLIVELKFYLKHPEDFKENRIFPSEYRFMEFTFRGKGSVINLNKENPWVVLKSGFRTIPIKESPKIINDLKELIPYFPFQVELGSGPSIEVGIPPLNSLHEIYYVSDKKTGNFILDPQKDRLMETIICDPVDFYKQAGKLYFSALTAKHSEFHLLLKRLYKQGLVVGPIITNNFDGLCSTLGLPEIYVRRYEEARLVPNICFHPAAKSLLVVGSHADRRLIQEAAREHGLKVIYIDPEGYLLNGKFISYPLEAPQNKDFLFRGTAIDFAKKWTNQLVLG